MRCSLLCRIITAAFVVAVNLSATAEAQDHPTPEQIQQAKDDGTYDARLARMMRSNPHRLSSGLAERAVYKIRRASLESAGLPAPEVSRRLLDGPQMAFPFTSPRELNSLGAVDTLTLLIDFKDHRAETELPGLDANHFHDNIYGEGTTQAQNHRPYESLNSYYRRASQNRVRIQGNVLGWHHFSEDRSDYEPATAPPGPNQEYAQALLDNQAIFDMLTAALEAHDATHDFAQYDNDDDGDIDLLTVLYAGPPTGWGTFWWAYRWQFFVGDAYTKEFDGKRLKQFVFQFVNTRGPANDDFNPLTLTHEMGHAFGLADYYDYDAATGPQGGVGDLDMMDGNLGNHNAFSRWLLDWIDLEVIGSGPPLESTLVASGSSLQNNKAVAVFPGLTNTVSPDQEMFIVENRTQFGNDALAATTPGNGLLIWHVDATVNGTGTDFVYDNSYTAHKLIRLVRADTADDFLYGEPASASTYFRTGTSFTPTSTTPSEGLYGPTNVSIDQISANGEVMTAHIGILPTVPEPSAVTDAEAIGMDPAFATIADDLVEAPPGPPAAYVDLDKLEKADRVFAAATPDQLSRLWKSNIPGKPLPGDSSQSSLTYQVLLTHWAAKDGPAAINAIKELPSCPFRSKTLSLALRTWANHDAAGAATWYLDDSQAGLRESADLIAGPEFAETLFEWYGRLDESQAISSIEKLTHSSDIWGAVHGLRNASATTDGDSDGLGRKLRALDKNGELGDSIRRIQETLEEAEANVNDPAQRAQLQEFIKSGMESR